MEQKGYSMTSWSTFIFKSVCNIFVWIMIKMQRLPHILNEKSTDKALFYLYEEISFICVTCLFDVGLVLKCLFNCIISIYIIFLFSYFYLCFYPKRRTDEDNRSNHDQQNSNNMQVIY